MTIETKKWIDSRIQPYQFEKYLKNGKDFISLANIPQRLRESKAPSGSQLSDILNKSLAIQNLTLDETATLLNVSDKDSLAEMRDTASKVKKKVYDNRIVTFAPLYLGNKCVNNCAYCGFRDENQHTKRKILSKQEILNEVKALTGRIGHKRLIVVYGEHPDTGIDYIVDSIKAIYSVSAKTKKSTSSIRRVNVNAPPLSVEELKILNEAGIGTYQVFQETYHNDTYAQVHPAYTLKGDYLWRLYAMHRALEAGIDDVGIGALFGLYDWKYEIMGLAAHAWELENTFGIGPHTVSFPRLETAENTPYVKKSFQNVTDEDFKKIITVIRLAIPYTGMILTARETPEIRREALNLGITQTDASSKIGIGSYSDKNDAQQGEKQQFFLGDTRTLDEVVYEQAMAGCITSFCTAGYRCGRTGKSIMKLLRTGAEGKFCKLNAVLTFREWLDDFASPKTKEAGEKLIEKEIAEIKTQNPAYFNEFMGYYEKIKNGERDIYI